MGEAHRRVGGVDRLAARAGGPKHVNADVFLGNVDLDLIHFGQDGGKDHNGTLFLVHNTIATPFIGPVVHLDAKNARAYLAGNIVWDAGAKQRNQVLAQVPSGADAAQFLMDARYTLGFVVESSANLASDRTLARQLALHGNYVVEGSVRLAALPQTGSLIIVAPAKNKAAAESPVRILAMVR